SLDATQSYLATDIETKEFDDWLCLLAHKMGVNVGRHGIAQIISVVRAQTRQSKRPIKVSRRLAFHGDSIFIDRGAAKDSIIHISKKGVTLTDKCPVLFLRTPSMGILPKPDLTGSFSELHDLFPQLDDNNFKKFAAAVLFAFYPTGP